jgi:hypothetical protein
MKRTITALDIRLTPTRERGEIANSVKEVIAQVAFRDENGARQTSKIVVPLKADDHPVFNASARTIEAQMVEFAFADLKGPNDEFEVEFADPHARRAALQAEHERVLAEREAENERRREGIRPRERLQVEDPNDGRSE